MFDWIIVSILIAVTGLLAVAVIVPRLRRYSIVIKKKLPAKKRRAKRAKR